VSLQRQDQLPRQRHYPIFAAFCASGKERFMFKVNVFYAQTECLHEPKTGSVEKTSNEPVVTLESTQKPTHFT
jgi:hypothetical protein